MVLKKTTILIIVTYLFYAVSIFLSGIQMELNL